jgi:hypothetical protein
MAIQSFEFDASLTASFAALRDELYRGDCNYISTSRSEFLRQFAPEFSFYQRPGNCHRHFIASANGKVIGHVSAFVNSDLKDHDASPIGILGFFECVEDYAAAADLLNHATEWLRKGNDLQRIWAPINFDIWHGYRLMTRGFAEKTFYGEPYNRAYYPEFFTRWGFSVRKTWDSLEMKGPATLEKMIARFESRLRSLRDEKYRFKSIDVNQTDDLQQLYSVLIRSYQGFLGITPVEFASFERLLGQYLKALDARFVNLVYDPGGNVAGFSVAYPDYSDALRAVATREGPPLRPKFSPGLTDRVIFYMIGATPEEVEKRHGLGSAMFYHTVRQILSAGFHTILFAIVADDSGVRRHLGDEMRFAQRAYTLYEFNR